jgi:hypothetical protein
MTSTIKLFSIDKTILCFNQDMNKLYILITLLIVQSVIVGACTTAPAQAEQPVEPVVYPTNTPAATATHTTSAPTLPPTKTPRTLINVVEYALTYDGITCPLKEVEFYDRYVFQADCGQQVNIPQGTTIKITLETLEDQPLPIGTVPDLETLFGALEPPFVMCQYGGVDANNTITFGSPFQQNTGRDILCAFSVPLQGEDAVITLTGLTTR